uniref:TERF1-interacting nuclear factor 2 N-terminal domain-containing protein n=1 Tax=Amphiprion ocellaris TaxID=80972 RepID=A0A3Q1AM51_AMPOC
MFDTPALKGSNTLLRVASARVYSIVKSRDVQHFETALRFLEATFRLLPRLVAAIKHMKIMFGLKTMSQFLHVQKKTKL